MALPARADAPGEVVTAGAYVVVDGLLPFMVGPTATGDRLGVVRLGGHREPHESGWACAAREVREEASIEVQALPPPATYWLAPPHDVPALRPGEWRQPRALGLPTAPAPVFVAWREEEGHRRLSLMYLALGEGTPTPASETQGLLLLRRRDVSALVQEPVTLGAFLRAGGCAILRHSLPLDHLLDPFLQLRVLASLLERHPDLLPALQ